MTLEQKPDVFLEARHIDKQFSGVGVLKDVSFSVRAGEVHAICGENGAGKSTLIKILSGVYKKDGGEICIGGRPVELTGPRQAIEMGIACIYQELSIVPAMDLAHNLFLGAFPRGRFGMVDRREMYRRAREILDQIGLKADAHTTAEKLSFAQQQLLEIGWALTRKVRLLILDEPTSALTQKESGVLFSLIRRLTSSGVAVVYISHKLVEVLEICDRVTVLRDGCVASTIEKSAFSRESLISHMVGRPLDDLYRKRHIKPRETALKVESLEKAGVFHDISFEVRHGEVVGMLGPVGSGRSSIAEAIFGLGKYDSGKIYIDGKPVCMDSPQAAMENGLALVPENRQISGLAMLMSVLSNMTIAKLTQINSFGIVDNTEKRRLATRYIDSIHIKAPSMDAPVRFLSGGNQQKVALSKWLMLQPDILILDEPTRGVDVEARAEIYAIISELAASGTAVLMISAEIQEIMGVCDRVLILREGHLTQNYAVGEITRDTLLGEISGGEIHEQ